MPRLIFVFADGREAVRDAEVGSSVLDCALDTGIAGLGGQCGGAANCGTCHCYVAPEFQDLVGPPTGDEAELITYLDDPRPSSRLACQIKMSAALDGLRVEVPTATA